jgi:hypothetical protein
MDLIKNAIHDHQEAAKRIIECTKDVYKVGQVVTVLLGGCTIQVKVTGVSDHWWHEPGLIGGVNLKTGKHRSFLHGNVLQ